MKTKLYTIALLFTCLLSAQWSTSPLADEGLYVCPGFDPAIVTFDDGSSIVLGMLYDYIYAQKLDPEGYKMWNEPVLAYHRDSSYMVPDGLDEGNWCCSDGDGGVIIYFNSNKDNYQLCGEPICTDMNNSTYLQRIDKNGNLPWGSDGILVSGLIEGLKQARITSDGEGGCVLLLSEKRFGYPGADSTNYLKIARYNAEGQQVWKTTLDSNTTAIYNYQLYNILHLGRFYYFGYMQHTINYDRKFYYDNGVISYYELSNIAIEVSPKQDYIFTNNYFSTEYTYEVSKINIVGDTLWTTSAYYGDKCPDAAGYLLPDNKGGTYIMWICNDTIMYFDSVGSFSYKYFKGIEIVDDKIYGGSYFQDGNGGIIAANTSTAMRYNSSGKQIWTEPVIYLSDPLNAHSEIHRSDNNGGLIDVYWSTLGGIYAQHTGRFGELGVVVGVDEPENNTSLDFALYQNYPNPFNPTTTIKYRTPPASSPLLKGRTEVGFVTLKVYNLLGQQVTTLVNKQQSSGTYEVQWNASNYPSGVYFYTLNINNKPLATKKLLLLK